MLNENCLIKLNPVNVNVNTHIILFPLNYYQKTSFKQNILGELSSTEISVIEKFGKRNSKKKRK